MNAKERLLTIAISVLTTLIVTRWTTPPQTVVAAAPASEKELMVDRLVVRRELIVSDTGQPWDAGFEAQQIPRGLVARSLAAGPDGKPGVAGVWVRSRLIKTEIDDPFDDRFHAMNRDGSIFGAPGHISWNLWLDGAWRQVAIIQGETLEPSETPRDQLSGGNHPGRLRFQSFRPNHPEPLTDAVIGQGKMSIGGGGYGGGGLPYPSEVLQLWGGGFESKALGKSPQPRVVSDDGSGAHEYAIRAIGPQGAVAELSPSVSSKGLATLTWDSLPGADAYVVLRDGRECAGPLRIEGSEKRWTDKP